MANSISKASGSQTYLRLLGYLKPHITLLFVGFVGFLIFAACDAGVAWWMKELVDSIQLGQSERRWWLASMIILLFLSRGVGMILGGYCTEYVARKVVNKLRGDVFNHILKMPSRFYEQYSSGSVLSKIIYNVENVSSASTNALRIIVRGGLTIIGLLLFMIYINWKLSIIFLILCPILAFVISLVTKRFRRYSKNIQDIMGNVGERTGEVLKGYEVVKIFDGFQHESDSFSKVIEGDRMHRLKLAIMNETSSTAVQLIFALALAALIIFAMHPEVLQSMTAGEFVAFVTAAGSISRPILQLTQVNVVIQQGIAAADSLFQVIDQPTEKDQGTKTLDHCQGLIEFSDVRFRYKEEQHLGRDWIIDQINFTIEPGTTCALVGRSGSGKTTIARLVSRFYDAVEGTVRIDGQALPEITLKSLRSNIALVNQNISLFNASIADNIAYGSLHTSTRDEIIYAAKHAQVMEFAEDLPNGLDTQIGEAGVALSGGQRQRIAIARAFLKNAPILILDEATSALDNHSERLIQTAIEELMEDRTSLVIAHRLSTVEKADKIIVLDEGRIVEQGSHEELLMLNGAYADMHTQGNDLE